MRVCFEPSRLAARCLIDAYERVVPSWHRRSDVAPQRRLRNEPRSECRGGGRQA
jgi:hypothetical protein